MSRFVSSLTQAPLRPPGAVLAAPRQEDAPRAVTALLPGAGGVTPALRVGVIPCAEAGRALTGGTAGTALRS